MQSYSRSGVCTCLPCNFGKTRGAVLFDDFHWTGPLAQNESQNEQVLRGGSMQFELGCLFCRPRMGARPRPSRPSPPREALTAHGSRIRSPLLGRSLRGPLEMAHHAPAVAFPRRSENVLHPVRVRIVSRRLVVCESHINVKSMVLYKGASIQRRISKQSYLYIPCRFSFRLKRWPLGTMINQT